MRGPKPVKHHYLRLPRPFPRANHPIRLPRSAVGALPQFVEEKYKSIEINHYPLRSFFAPSGRIMGLYWPAQGPTKRNPPYIVESFDVSKFNFLSSRKRVLPLQNRGTQLERLNLLIEHLENPRIGTPKYSWRSKVEAFFWVLLLPTSVGFLWGPSSDSNFNSKPAILLGLITVVLLAMINDEGKKFENNEFKKNGQKKVNEVLDQLRHWRQSIDN